MVSGDLDLRAADLDREPHPANEPTTARGLVELGTDQVVIRQRGSERSAVAGQGESGIVPYQLSPVSSTALPWRTPDATFGEPSDICRIAGPRTGS